jgi:hypothetical protein
MSETTTLPLFYRRVVGINPQVHGQLRLDRSTGFAFAAGAQSVPLGLSEIEAASRHYPILFTAGPHTGPVALLGLNQAGNLFVQPDGTWRSDCYIPAYLRAWPFIFVQDEAADRVFLGMEPDAACLGETSGQRLFEDGTPTAVLNDAVAFCSSWRDNLAASAAFAAALDEAGVLAQEEATVNFAAGGAAHVHGFKLVRADLLDAVPDETFLDWRRRGWLGLLYAHLQSSAQWARLIDLAAARR